MREVVYDIDLNLQEYDIKACMQNDDIKLIVNILKKEKLYDLTGAKATLNWSKPDGTPLRENMNIDKNMISVTLNKDYTDIKGKARLDIEITKEGTISTFPLVLVIVEKVFQSNKVNNKIVELLDIIKMDEYVDEFLDSIKKKQTELSSQIDEKANQSSLKTLESRMNNFTSLQNGSTTGDAELIDGRIGANGEIYQNIGSAIREQYNELKENLDDLEELAELNALGQEHKVWYQNGVRNTDGGWKLVRYDVSTINKIFVTGMGRAYRDFVTCFKDETYIKSLTQNADTNYVDHEYNVSDSDTVYVLQYANTDAFSVKIATQKTDKYTVSDRMQVLDFVSDLHGYFQKTTFTKSEGDRTYIYDVRDCRKVSIKGTLTQYNNIYTLLDENNNGLNYDFISSSGNDNIDVTVDVTNYDYIAISDKVNNGIRVIVSSDVNFRNSSNEKSVSINEKSVSIYKSWIPMKWNGTVNYTYQRNNQYSPNLMVSNSYDVSKLNTVRVKAKSSAYVNYYTLIKNGSVIGYNFNNSENNLVEIDEIVDVSNADTLLVTVDHGHEARQGACYTEEQIYKSNLYGKRIGWWGTSIPAFGSEGYNHPESYPKIIGGMLGAEVINHAVGESCVHCKDYTLVSSDNPYGFVEDFRNVSRCLTNTIAEMQWVIDNFKSGVFTKNVPASLSADDKALILGCSYENRLLPYLDTTDLFVFDHGHNDKADTGNHAYDTVKTTYGEKNLYSYIGAMNWIMDLIKTNNPRAEIIQISEYDYNTNRYGVEKQRKFAEMWGIPFMELYKLTGWTSPLTIRTTGYWGTDGYWVSNGGSAQNLTIRQMYLKDDLHPYTDRSNKTSWYLAELIANWMKNTL